MVQPLIKITFGWPIVEVVIMGYSAGIQVDLVIAVIILVHGYPGHGCISCISVWFHILAFCDMVETQQ